MLHGVRAEYGKQIVAILSQQLTIDYGDSFSEKNLRRMIQFAEVFPDELDCRITNTTIELVTFQGAIPS
ncbi:DUF1016 N-terminal domain-containing protein [Geotalea uraniireducens]|uniref:DUF1016 N-terminal domain-containing protein n=1 Tax=Geotalea uraniireducens TaxID=351604 RepID=UPI00006BCF10|nr:DUF1016 N-terminal domain-containing protein [Geotalea uraniireducens]